MKKDNKWAKRTVKHMALCEERKEMLSASDLYPISMTELDHFDNDHLVVDEFGDPCGENFKNE